MNVIFKNILVVFIFVILVLFFSYYFVFGKLSNQIVNSIDPIVKEIKQTIKTCKIVEKPLPKMSSEGGYIKGYYDGEFLISFETGLFGDMGKTISNYYFNNGEIIFIKTTDYNYNVPFYIDEKVAKEDGYAEFFDEQKTIEETNKYYFDKGDLVLWIDEDKNKVANKSMKFISKNNEFKSDIIGLRDILNGK